MPSRAAGAAARVSRVLASQPALPAPLGVDPPLALLELVNHGQEGWLHHHDITIASLVASSSFLVMSGNLSPPPGVILVKWEERPDA
jgi:hypothetical protein